MRAPVHDGPEPEPERSDAAPPTAGEGTREPGSATFDRQAGEPAKLIVNPASGRDTAPDHLPALNAALRELVPALDIVLTVAAGDAERSAERAARDEAPYVFVAGGDGTLNEVVNGVARVPGALRRTTFGLVPLGTGNDFAQGLGIPEDVAGALDVIRGGKTVDVDLGRLGDRAFVNVSAGGFTAEVSDAVDPRLKSFAGKLAYLIGGAQVLFDYEPPEAHIVAETPDGRVERQMAVALYAVCNSRMVGGGRLIAPHAVVDDGLLDLCVVEAMPLVEFVELLTRVSGGDHVDDPRVTYLRTNACELRFSRRIKVNTDGEVLETEVCRYEVVPRAVRFFAPAASSSPAA
jgi:diacylglycerol kinase (ATP)